MTFYAIELDTCPAYGWEGGPNTDIDIKALRTKRERRNWPDGVILHTFALRFLNVKHAQHLEDIKSMFMVMHGPHNSFLCKDYSDFRHGFASDDQAAMEFATVVGGEESFQLSKTYTKGAASFVRPITKPVLSTVTIYVNGIATDADVDPLTGLVTFTTADWPEPGDVLSWTGEFRVPVRFSNFYQGATIDGQSGDEEHILNVSCTLQEVVGE